MTFFIKISCLLIGISFSMRLHTPIAFGISILLSVLIVFVQKRIIFFNWLKSIENKEIFYITILVFFSFSLSSIFSINPLRSIPVVIYLFIFMFCSLLLYFHFVKDNAALLLSSNFFLISISFASFLVFSFNISEYFSVPRIQWSGEVKKYKGFTNLLVLCVSICPLIQESLGHKNKILSYLLFTLLIPIIYISNCNSAVLGIFIGIFLILIVKVLLSLENVKRNLSICVIVFFIGVASILKILSDQYPRENISDINFIIPTNIVDPHRQIIWGFSINKFKNNWLIGVGPDTSNFIEGSQEMIGHKDTGTMHYIPSHPHNFIIELLLETGIFGFLSILLLIAYLNYYFIKKNNYKNVSTLVFLNGYFWGSSIVNFSFWAAWWQGSYYLVLAIVLSIISRKNQKIKDETDIG